MNMNKQLLDPIGTMCKLIALNFNEISTKMSIQDHILTLQAPTGYQFIVRLYNGDGRENISELYYVIVRLIKWYLVPDSELNIDTDQNLNDTQLQLQVPKNNSQIISESEEIKQMITYLCDAFKKLQVTYSYGNVVLAIQFYINILQDGLNGKYDDTRLPEYLLKKEQEYDNLLDYSKLKNLWDCTKLKRICKLYENCFDTINDDTLTYCTKHAYIKGYLKSIETILKSTDRDFQELIKNSKKG